MADKIPTLEEIRERYPIYKDRTDVELLRALNKKYKPEMDIDAFTEQYFPAHQVISASKDKQAESSSIVPGLKSIGSDFVSSVAGIPGHLLGQVRGIPGAVSEFGSAVGQIKEDPSRSLKNIGYGLLEKSAGIPNIPGNIAKYFGSKFPDLQQYTDQIPEFDRSDDLEWLRGHLGIQDEQAGDAALQGLGGFAPYSAAYAINPFVGASLQAIGENEDPIHAASTIGALKYGPAAVRKVGKGAKGVKEYAQSYAYGPTANKIKGATEEVIEKFNPRYNDLGLSEVDSTFFGKAKNAPKLKNFFENSLPSEDAAIKSVLQSKNTPLQALQDAQSELGFFERRMENIIKHDRKLTKTENQGLREAKAARKVIKDEIKKQLGSEKGAAYDLITEQYAKEAGPLVGNDAITRFRQGRLTPQDFIETLRKNKEFKAAYGDQFPGIDRTSLFSGALAKLGYILPKKGK